jgi:hypothetical protein
VVRASVDDEEIGHSIYPHFKDRQRVEAHFGGLWHFDREIIENAVVYERILAIFEIVREMGVTSAERRGHFTI